MWMWWGFPGSWEVKNLLANARDTRNEDLIPGWGRSPGIGSGNSLQYSCLKTSMDRGAGGLQSTGSQRVTRKWAHTHDVSVAGKSWIYNQVSSSFWQCKLVSRYAVSQFYLFFKNICLFVYLATPGLSNSVWDLGSSLQNVESLLVACKLLVPWPGIEPRLPTLGMQSLSHWTTKNSVGVRLFQDSVYNWLLIIRAKG